jgi:hypothetical protein
MASGQQKKRRSNQSRNLAIAKTTDVETMSPLMIRGSGQWVAFPHRNLVRFPEIAIDNRSPFVYFSVMASLPHERRIM